MRPVDISRLSSLSLSLLVLAGCATPSVTAPTTQDAASQASAPVTAAGAPAATAPQAAPATTAQNGVVMDGVATYRGEALGGYSLQVFDARTGNPVPVVTDLNGTTGLAVKASSLTTEANGAFHLEVAGLSSGQALRVSVSKGYGTLEALVMGDGTGLATAPAAGYTTLDATQTLKVNELSTALNKLVRGLVRASRVLKNDAAAPVLRSMADQLRTLAPQIQAQLATGNFAQSVVQEDGAALGVALANAGQARSVAQTIVNLATEVAKQAQDSANRSEATEGSTTVDLTGTPLSLNLDLKTGAVTLKNIYTGQSVSALEAASATGLTSIPVSHGDGNGPIVPAFPDAFKRVRLFDLSARWTVGVIRLAPGLLPTDFKAFQAELYDRDGNLLTTQTADPAGFPVPKTKLVIDNLKFSILEDADSDQRSYFVPLIFKRPVGDSGNVNNLLAERVKSPKARQWDKGVFPGIADSAQVTYTLDGETEPHSYSITGAPIKQLAPLWGGELPIHLEDNDPAKVTSLTVTLLDQDQNTVGSATIKPESLENWKNRRLGYRVPAYTVLLKTKTPPPVTFAHFGPAPEKPVPDDFTYGPFLGKPAKLVLKFTERNGYVHTETVESRNRDFDELPNEFNVDGLW